MPNLYAEIILPVPVARAFTYAVPSSLEQSIAVGHRVIVPFGRKKYLTGIIRSLTPRPTAEAAKFEIKEIAALLDNFPVVRHPQLKIWEWIADYYMCTPGEVMRAAVPAGLKVESETYVEINPDYERGDDEQFDEAEAIVYQLLDHEGAMSVDAIQRDLGERSGARVVSRMIDRGLLIVSEKLVERYRSKRKHYVRPAFTADGIKEAFAAVKGAKKQEVLLMALIEMSAINRRDREPQEVSRKALLERSGVTTAILSAIVKKGLAEVYVKEINRFKYDGTPRTELPTLSEAQQKAYDEILDGWIGHSTVLLHGVTAGGKTEIYSHLISDAFERGEQVLYLVPEIALTTQLTRRLQKIFGDRVVVYHSKFSDNERVDIWKSMLADDGRPKVILGARSSVFLPFSRLGLVIVDEEHDTSYRQADPAPRYNGRDVALLLASMHGARALLGSATPSIDTYYKALHGKFGLATLSKRFHDVPIPPVRLVDMTLARKKGAVSGPFSLDVIGAVNKAVTAGRQAILFRNRRGFAPMVRCKQCAWTPKCDHCDVTLTYHNAARQLVCHYCGAIYSMPDICPQCQQPAIEIVGYGTERVEDDVQQAFPAARVLRMDLDTTRNKDAYETIIDNFSAHRADILVGTQMVTKGLDFSGVSVVAVLNADELINIPDYRAAERAFNMLEQVSGRAGRADAEGSQVIVQTYKPDQPLLEYLLRHDYRGFYNYEIEERRRFNYPPFTHVVYLYLKNRDRDVLQEFSNLYAQRLAEQLGNRVAGPDQPKVSRVKGLYIQKIMIKLEAAASMAQLRAVLRATTMRMATHPAAKSTTLYYDVDV